MNEKYVSTLSEIKYGDETEVITNDGFFTLLDSSYSKEKGVGSFNIVFYPDQTVCFFYVFIDSLKSCGANTDLWKYVNKWGRKNSIWGQMWGVYSKKNDSILTDMYDIMGPYYPTLDISKELFLLRKDTLLHIKHRGFGAKNEKPYDKERNDVYVYVHSDSIPNPSNHFLKKKKWTWKNPEDWMEYMESSGK